MPRVGTVDIWQSKFLLQTVKFLGDVAYGLLCADPEKEFVLPFGLRSESVDS